MERKYDDIVKKILVDENEIIEISKRLGEQITKDYAGNELVVVGMLKGGMPFMMELIKHIKLPLVFDFIQAKSYEGTKSTDYVVLKKDVDTDLKGKHVLIVDDVLDTAQTITKVLEVLADRGTASIELCCLLDKKEGRKVQYDAKYIGKEIPNEFVIGYGLDYNEYYRNLPYVAVVKDEVYK
jgi:hypoxanthine phosphoribosyltransferase